MTIREQIIKALDDIGPEALPGVLEYLEGLKSKAPAREISREEFERILKSAPIAEDDDDPKELAEARKDIKEGRTISLEKYAKQNGIEL